MSKSTAQPKPNKLLRLLFFSFIALLLFLAVLPIGIKFAGQYVLKDLGADEAYIGDVDLNLFTGRFALKDVQITSKQQQTVLLNELVFDLSIQALLRKQLLVEKLSIIGLDVNVFQHDDTWVVGIPLPEADANEAKLDEIDQEEQLESTWGFGVNSIHFENINAKLSYQEENFSVYINELALSELLMWEPENRTPFTINGSINNAPLRLSSELEPFTETPFIQFDLKLSDFDLGFVSSFLPDDVKQLSTKLFIDTRVQVHLQEQGKLSIKQQGGFALSDVRLATEELQAGLSKLGWRGKADVSLDQQQNAIANLEGKLEASLLEVNHLDLLLGTQLEEFSWQGSVALDTSHTMESLQLVSDINLVQWLLHDGHAEADLTGFERLSFDQLKLQGLDDIQLQNISLEGVKALAGDQFDLANLAQLNVQNVHLKQQSDLYIEQVFIQDPSAKVLLNQHGNIDRVDDWLLPLIEKVQQYFANDEAEVIAEAPSTDSKVSESEIEIETGEQVTFSYQLDKLIIQASEAISFTDQTISPAVKHQVILQKIDLGKISSKQLEALTPIDVQLKLYKHGKFTVAGELTLLQAIEQMNGQLNAAIKGIELADVSPYIEKNVGYQARSGQFNSESQAAIKQGKLDSKTKVRIQRIDLKPHNEEAMAKASKSIAMPVSTALKIITDKNNTLKLTVPVKGDLSNPDVKVNKIMSEAITQAVKNTALTYFKFAVQPFGAIMMVSQAIGNATLQARFEDVRFEAGTAEMVKEQKGYLAKVAEMIKEKKDFSVVACVYVTDEDFLARKRPPKLAEGEKYQWDEESKELAEDRLEYIRSSLIERHGLESNQIQACKSQLGKGQPRAILGI